MNPRVDDDELLLRGCRRGDGGALREAIRRLTPIILAATESRRLTSDDAADIAQTTWIAFLDAVPTLQGGVTLTAWLTVTARHTAARQRRRRRRELLDDGQIAATLTDQESDPADTDTATATATDKRRVRALDHATRRLPPRQQTLVHYLHTHPDASYSEIAAATGIPIGSIGPTRQRAFTRLRTDLIRAGIRAQE